MGIFGKRKARKAAEAAAKKRDGVAQDIARTSYASQRGAFSGFKSNAGESKGQKSRSSGPNKSGNDNYVSPELVRSKESITKLTPKKATKIEAPKSETNKVKRSTQKAPAPTNTGSPRQKREDEFNAEKKKSTPAKDYSKNTTKPYKGVTSDDKKSQAKIASSNERVKKNREAKAAAIKAGKSTYKMVNKAGQTVVGKV